MAHCNGTGKQPPAEPQGDVVENEKAVQLLAERLYRFAAIQQGWSKRWPDLPPSTQNGYRNDARCHLEKLTPLLYKQWRSSYEERLQRMLGDAEARREETRGEPAKALAVTRASVLGEVIRALNEVSHDA